MKPDETRFIKNVTDDKEFFEPNTSVYISVKVQGYCLAIFPTDNSIQDKTWSSFCENRSESFIHMPQSRNINFVVGKMKLTNKIIHRNSSTNWTESG